MAKQLKYRELRKILEGFGFREYPKRGKGSERWFENDDGVGCTVTCHGVGGPVGKGLVRSVRRKLGLTPDNGVSDEDFFG